MQQPPRTPQRNLHRLDLPRHPRHQNPLRLTQQPADPAGPSASPESGRTAGAARPADPGDGHNQGGWWGRLSTSNQINLLTACATTLAAVATFVTVAVAWQQLGVQNEQLGLQNEQLLTGQEQAEHALDLQNQQLVTSQLLEVDLALVEHAELRSCFAADLAEAPCPALASGASRNVKAAGAALAVLHLDLFDAVYDSSQTLYGAGYPADLEVTTSESDAWNAWTNFVANTFRASPLTCRVLQAQSREYSASFIGAVQAARLCP